MGCGHGSAGRAAVVGAVGIVQGGAKPKASRWDRRENAVAAGDGITARVVASPRSTDVDLDAKVGEVRARVLTIGCGNGNAVVDMRGGEEASVDIFVARCVDHDHVTRVRVFDRFRRDLRTPDRPPAIVDDMRTVIDGVADRAGEMKVAAVPMIVQRL